MAEWSSATDLEVLSALSAAQQALNTAQRKLLQVVQEAAARHLGPAHGYVTDVELVRCTQNITKAEAARRIAAADAVLPGRTLTGEPIPPGLPDTAAAFAEAAVSAEHVAVVGRVQAGLPPHLEAHRDELETYLAGHARTFDPHALRLLGRRRLEFLDQDGPAPRDTPPTRNRLSLAEDGDGWDLRGWLDREAAAILRTALSPLSAPVPAADGERDTRSVAERQGDGLIELARRALTQGGLPTEGGERPHVTVTVPMEVLESRVGNGLLDFADDTVAGVIAAEDARRWACDASVTRIVLGGRSEPLDVGRATRVVPRAMRRALVQRDGGCAFPGCTTPAQWCDGHHIRHWAEGGPTALTNLVLLCGRHHSLIHRGEWSVTITGGFPLFHPPPWISGEPRRNPIHRIDLDQLHNAAARAPDGRPRRVAALLCHRR